MTPKHLSEILNEKAGLSFKHLEMIAQALNVSISYLIGETEVSTPVSQNVNSIPTRVSIPQHNTQEKDQAGMVIVVERGEGNNKIRLELPPTPETYAFLREQIGITLNSNNTNTRIVKT